MKGAEIKQLIFESVDYNNIETGPQSGVQISFNLD
jgi:hypothetical protein